MDKGARCLLHSKQRELKPEFTARAAQPHIMLGTGNLEGSFPMERIFCPSKSLKPSLGHALKGTLSLSLQNFSGELHGHNSWKIPHGFPSGNLLWSASMFCIFSCFQCATSLISGVYLYLYIKKEGERVIYLSGLVAEVWEPCRKAASSFPCVPRNSSWGVAICLGTVPSKRWDFKPSKHSCSGSLQENIPWATSTGPYSTDFWGSFPYYSTFYHFSSEQKTFIFIASVRVDRFVIEMLRIFSIFSGFTYFHSLGSSSQSIKDEEEAQQRARQEWKD